MIFEKVQNFIIIIIIIISIIIIIIIIIKGLMELQVIPIQMIILNEFTLIKFCQAR